MIYCITLFINCSFLKVLLSWQYVDCNLNFRPIWHQTCLQGGFSFYHFSEEDLNAKNSGGYTPLMYAAYIGHDNVVNMLIDAQVDVNLSNDKGHSPLMLAASCGNESVCEFLKDVSKQCLFMIYPKQLYYFGGYIIIRVSSPQRTLPCS